MKGVSLILSDNDFFFNDQFSSFCEYCTNRQKINLKENSKIILFLWFKTTYKLLVILINILKYNHTIFHVTKALNFDL